jgi:hypothetical protein
MNKLSNKILYLLVFLLVHFSFADEAVYHPADTDTDWHLSESEMEAFVSKWQKGQEDISDTIRGLYLSYNFESYKYDGSRPRPLCWLADNGGQNGDETGVNKALIIGINEYLHANSLTGCVNDANGIRDKLLLTDEAWCSDNVTILLNSSATVNSVRSQILALAASSHAGDIVLFAQSSHGGLHGGTNSYMCEYDGNYEDYQLAQDLAEFDEGVKVVLIIDTCHSGGLFKAKNGNLSAEFAKSVMNYYKEIKVNRAGGKELKESFGSNIAFMTASDYNEYSYDSYYFQGRRYGYYIGHLIEATYTSRADVNGDGRFQLMEMHNYAANNVYDQTPQYLNDNLLNSISFKGNVGSGNSGGFFWSDRSESVPRAKQGVWQTIEENVITIEVLPAENVKIWGLEEVLPEGVTPDDFSKEHHANWDAETRRLTWWGTGNANLTVTVSGEDVKKQLQCKANADGTNIDIYGDFMLYLPGGGDPAPVAYAVVVENGIAKVGDDVITTAAAGVRVTVTANDAPDGMVFGSWTCIGVELEDTTMNPATFEMPANDVNLTANFVTIPDPVPQGSFTGVQFSEGYLNGRTCVITYRIDITNMELNRFAICLPEGWTYHSDTLANCEGEPQFDEETSKLIWIFDTPATTSLNFTVHLNVPANFEGVAEIPAWVYANDNYVSLTENALEIASRMRYHSADSNKDGKISLDELLQVIRLYNFEAENERTGEYHSDPDNGIDGFAPGPFDNE